jgi:hypothetical protein
MVNKIAAYNGIKNVNALSVGQKVWVPGPLYWTNIQAPDTIKSIARYYGFDPLYLARLNGLPSADSEIYIGNNLLIQR